MKQSSINISKLKVRVKHSISRFDLAMDLLYLFKANFKNLLFIHQSREGASRICLICQIFFCYKDGGFEEYGRMYHEAVINNFLAQKYRGLSPNTFRGMEAYGTL